MSRAQWPLLRGRPIVEITLTEVAVGVQTPPTGFDGIACFRFLNRFTYGNFGSSTQFGLEN
jgi:hypothetical protein